VAGVISENSIRPGFASRGRIIASSGSMLAILHSLGMFVADLFKPRCRLEAENLFLRHQLSIALRRAPRRLRLRGVEPCGFVTVHRFAQLAPLRERSFSHHQGERRECESDQRSQQRQRVTRDHQFLVGRNNVKCNTAVGRRYA